MKTFSAKPETVRRDWFVVDASGKTLGRLATELARRLRGKHKPEFTPHVDTGDYIVVINAEKVRVTGKKMSDKVYYHHTGYIGHTEVRDPGQAPAARPRAGARGGREGHVAEEPARSTDAEEAPQSSPVQNTPTRPSSPRRWRSELAR